MTAEQILLQIAPSADTVANSADIDKLAVLKFIEERKLITVCPQSTFHFVRNTIKKILQDNIPGDILLAGVWRGGLAAYIQALLIDHHATNRKLFLADTFSGFVNITDAHPKDKKSLDDINAVINSYLASGIDKNTFQPYGSPSDIKKVFRNFDLPMENIVLLEGDVKNTTADFSGPLAMLLVDLDFYTPTWDCLSNIYSHISDHGYIYIDDYNILEYQCKEAVDDFISLHRINAQLETVNRTAVSWTKE